MNRPYIVCHMMTALDGRIIGDFMNTPEADIVGGEYKRINDLFHSQAWLCGRVTMEDNFKSEYHLPGFVSSGIE